MREVEYRKHAARKIRQLARDEQLAVMTRTQALAEDPTPPASIPMKGNNWKGWRRLRVGGLRAIYWFDDTTVSVAVVFRRGQGYPDAPP